MPTTPRSTLRPSAPRRATPSRADLLLTAARVIPVAAEPVSPGAVAIRDGAIAAVGPPAAIRGDHADLPVSDLGEVILAPGFVDTHAHTEWALSGGIASGPGFGRWLGRFLQVMVPPDPERQRVASELAVVAALRAGTTTLCDAGPTGAGVAALTAAGMRGVVCHEVFGNDPSRAVLLEETLLALDERAGSRVRVGVSPHAPYSVGPRLWAALAGRSGLAGRPWCTHLAESPDEVRVLETGDGPMFEALGPAYLTSWPAPPGASPTGRLQAHGALRRGLVAAHCVQVDEPDLDTLAAHDVRVAHCPISNSRLGCGRMPLERLWAHGLTVGLGSDSPGSAGAYDIRAEARACEVLHGATGEPPSAERLVRMATIDGARVLGMGDQLGTLEPGKRADLIAVAPPAGALGPGDPYEALLRADARVVAAWVDGHPVLVDGEPMGIDAGRAEARAAEVRHTLC